MVGNKMLPKMLNPTIFYYVKRPIVIEFSRMTCSL